MIDCEGNWKICSTVVNLSISGVCQGAVATVTDDLHACSSSEPVLRMESGYKLNKVTNDL